MIVILVECSLLMVRDNRWVQARTYCLPMADPLYYDHYLSRRLPISQFNANPS